MIDAVYQALEQRESEQQRWLDSRPKCCECGEPIQDEKLYNIHGDLYCEDCINDFREDTDNHTDRY